jgi:hypothetical protein
MAIRLSSEKKTRDFPSLPHGRFGFFLREENTKASDETNYPCGGFIKAFLK